MAKIQTAFTNNLKIDLPIIVAPMFLVSNVDMLVAAAESGAIGAVPALNYRPIENFKKALEELKSKTSKPYGVNLIVQKSNPMAKDQLKIALEAGVPFFIT